MKRSSAITWPQLKVGVVIIVALVILTLAVYKLGQAANLFTKRYSLVIFLGNANGLQKGSTVLVAGQVAGTVSRVDFLPPDQDTTRNLELTLSIDRNLQTQVRRDSKAAVKTLGLLGDKVIDINPGTPRYAVLRTGDTLAVSPSLDYDAVLNQAAGAVGDVVALTKDLRQLTGGLVQGRGTMGALLTDRGLYDQLTSTLQRTSDLLVKMQDPNGTFGRMLDDPRLYNNLVNTVSSADSLVIAMNSRNGTLGSLLRDTTLYRNMVGISRGADSLMTMLAHGNGFASKMLTDQTLYDQLNKLVGDLSALIADMRKDPGRYMKGVIKVF